MAVLCDCKGPMYVYRIAWGSMEWSLMAYIYRCVGVMCLEVCVLRVLLWKGAVCFVFVWVCVFPWGLWICICSFTYMIICVCEGCVCGIWLYLWGTSIPTRVDTCVVHVGGTHMWVKHGVSIWGVQQCSLRHGESWCPPLSAPKTPSYASDSAELFVLLPTSQLNTPEWLCLGVLCDFS